MRTALDMLRSLARYTYEVLGPEWEVRPLAEQGSFERPHAVVEPAGGQVITGPPHTVDIVQPYVIHAFCEKKASPPESLHEAARVEELLWLGFRRNGNRPQPRLPGPASYARPGLVPLWDWEDVDFTQGSDVRRDPDYAAIRDLTIERVQTPSDELLYTVTAEIRLNWRRDGVLPDGKTAREMRIDYVSSG
jgi:hypothetical protein